ncbi:hypothetical protein Trydic_g7897 [Trypoxylus dichotomus]
MYLCSEVEAHTASNSDSPSLGFDKEFVPDTSNAPQAKLNDLAKDINLTKNAGELSDSILQGNNLLAADTQRGFINFPYYMCEQDNRTKDKHWRQWPKRKSLTEDCLLNLPPPYKT